MHRLIIATLVGLCLTLPGQIMAGEQSTNADVAAIEKLYATWRDAVEGSDIDTYISLLHNDIRLMPPGAPTLTGADNYRTFLQPVFATATYDIEIDRIQEIDILGDVAIAEYDYTIALNRKDPEVGVTEPGALTGNRTTARYFDVLRKNADGQWRVWRHAWQAL